MIRAKIDDKRLMIKDNRQWNSKLEALNGRNVVLELHDADKRSRTAQMNAYYWAVIVTMINAELQNLGWECDKMQTHAFLKDKFLRDVMVNKTTGEAHTIILASSGLTLEDFANYMEKCIKFASTELGTIIPAPSSD